MVSTSLGGVIERHRTALGITRVELAKRAGVSYNTLMKMEQGFVQDPGLFKTAALSRSIGISLDDLVRDALVSTPERRKMTYGIVSLGYEGKTIDRFVEILVEHGVGVVADVRLNPISRKPGFSKTRFKEALEDAGIRYEHLRPLGNDKDNREPFWTGKISEGRAVFRKSIKNEMARSALKDLAMLAKSNVVAVVCFEADEENCHRHVVIDEITRREQVPVVQV